MEMGIIGLGRMGFNMSARLVQDGHRVVAFNRTKAKLEEAAKLGIDPANSVQEMVQSLKTPRVVWIMVPAGQPTDDMLEAAAEHMSPGDILIDGGNSNFKDSQRRAAHYQSKNLHFMDAGTSGGIWGLKVGYCLMVGGPEEAFKTAEPLFKSLAPPNGYKHVGAAGAGHFVKMVHNGIEYGMLQSYAEGFEIMRAAKDYDLDLTGIAKLWNQGSVVRSWLLELAESALKEDNDLSSIQGYVEDSGEGRWTVITAIEEDVPAPVITLSLQMRFRSRQADSYAGKVIAAIRKEFGGHAVKAAPAEEGETALASATAPGSKENPSVAQTETPLNVEADLKNKAQQGGGEPG
jgi:6-phosphogluconate dehydrogenase